jgi:hypothetical protein
MAIAKAGGARAPGLPALALITYGQIEDRARGMTAALIQEDGAWKRTNVLSADETLDFVWSAFRVGEMAAQP